MWFVPPRVLTYVLRRAIQALLLVLVVSSAGLLLARLAPGDHLATFDRAPETIEAERRRLGLDRPLYEQYARWASGAARLDLGESSRFPGRRVSELLEDRAVHSVLLGAAALAFATAIGIPLGVFTGSRRSGAMVHTARLGTLLLLSVPPVVWSLALLVVAVRTGWFPVGGLPDEPTLVDAVHHLALPVLALGLPVAAVLERLQARALAGALRDPAVLAARARGISKERIVWRHAFRLSLPPVLAVYGIIVGGLISGSFVVEYVMTWPGLGRLMYDALTARDANLVAGCAAVGAACLAAGVLLADVALALADPRAGWAR
jgi:peptide/nickel transport system permease protein